MGVDIAEVQRIQAAIERHGEKNENIANSSGASTNVTPGVSPPKKQP
jgi:phosphopantetheinyl transferase (holo-ACP synthase)